MVLFDHRMVEGSPLHYYNPYQYFGRADLDYGMNEDLLIMPQSPASAQSDSENSMSSVELSVKPPKQVHNKQIQCCWRSCGVAFDSLDQLAAHVGKVHAASGPGGLFYCGWEGCTRNDRGFNARYKMLVHVRTHTNEKPHQCYQCDKSFSRAENLKIHTRSHSGEKPYVCPVPGCKKAYSNSSDRFKHSRTHQEDKPYQCKVPGCPKRYTDPSSLRKHVKTYKHFAEKSQESVAKATGCDCQRSDCCVTSCLLKLGAFINLKDGEMRWNELLNPFMAPGFQGYADGPLDLSISRKQ